MHRMRVILRGEAMGPITKYAEAWNHYRLWVHPDPYLDESYKERAENYVQSLKPSAEEEYNRIREKWLEDPDAVALGGLPSLTELFSVAASQQPLSDVQGFLPEQSEKADMSMPCATTAVPTGRQFHCAPPHAVYYCIPHQQGLLLTLLRLHCLVGTENSMRSGNSKLKFYKLSPDPLLSPRLPHSLPAGKHDEDTQMQVALARLSSISGHLLAWAVLYALPVANPLHSGLLSRIDEV